MKVIKAMLFLGSYLLSLSCYATVSYSLEYDTKSSIKNIPLQNAEIRIEGYAFENPAGYYNIKTDANQSFNLEKPAVLEVVSIRGEDKYNARCSGNSTPGSETIKISCEPKNTR